MFVGHYGPALLAQASKNAPSLAMSFVAVQLVDVGFFTLAYWGIERWKPDPGLHGITPLDLYYMPYTHSLAGAAIWAVAAGALLYLLPRRRRASTAIVLGLLVFSHWLLDLLVHRRDLGILDDELGKLGFGLWDHPGVAMPLELGLLLLGFAIYLRATRAQGPLGALTPWLVLAGLLGLQAVNWFGPIPSTTLGFSAFGLLAYGIGAALGYLLDVTRARAGPASQ
jgi:hypothetical protein